LQGTASIVDVLALESLRKTAARSGCAQSGRWGYEPSSPPLLLLHPPSGPVLGLCLTAAKTSMPLHRSTEDLSRASPCLVNTTIFCGMPCRTNIWCRTSTCGQTQRRCPHAADAHSDHSGGGPSRVGTGEAAGAP